MSFLDDFLNLFSSNSENFRRESEHFQEDWVDVRDDFSTFGATVVDFLDSIDGRNNVHSSCQFLMEELRDESRRRVESTRERIRGSQRRIRRSYQIQHEHDMLRMQELMHQSIEETVSSDVSVQNLKKVNWKKEGF